MTSLQQVISRRFQNVTSDLKNPQPWLFDAWGIPNDSGIQVSERTALTHMAFWRAVNLVAGSIASLPKHLFVRIESDGKKQKRISRDHPAHRIISRRPNSYQHSHDFHFLMLVQLLLRGNFYALIRRNGFFDLVSLIPVPTWQVTPKIEKGRKVFHVEGTRRVFTNNEMLHIKGLSLDGIVGVNPIKNAIQALGLGMAAEKMQSSAFGKGLHAGGVITMPEENKGMLGSTDEEAEQYMSGVRNSFKKLYQNGSESWHEMMFLEPGWKFEQFKLNLETAQIIETRKFSVAEMARLVGVPLHKVMQLDKATENNMEQQGIEYVQDTVMRLTDNIESEYNQKLLKTTEQDDHFFKFNLDGLMRADLKSRYEAYSTALGKNAPGFITPAEVRDLEDMGEIDEDELFKPDNMNKQNAPTTEAA